MIFPVSHFDQHIGSRALNPPAPLFIEQQNRSNKVKDHDKPAAAGNQSKSCSANAIFPSCALAARQVA